MVDGIILAIEHRPPSGHAVYDIGTGVGTSLLTVANLIQTELGSSKDIVMKYCIITDCNE